MTKKYLLRFTPIEPYFLGGENTFRADETSKYYATSLFVPTATTIIGTLRYTLLKLCGVLNINGKYTEAEKQVCDALVGATSYTVGGNNDFGKIKSISPLFLMQGDDIYIKTPLNCKTDSNQSHYRAIRLGQQRYLTSFGTTIRFPLEEEYSTKQTVSDQSYMRLSDGAIVNDLFGQVERAGISKSKVDKAYFKKTYTSLKEGFSFAVVAEIEEDVPVRDTICHMGREKSVFLLHAQETDLDIEAQIKSSLARCTDDTFYYVFGDTFVLDGYTYSDFAMVRTEHIRMLQTQYTNNALKITCINRFHQIIKSGSVFYGDDACNDTQTQYGFNKIIKIEV